MFRSAYLSWTSNIFNRIVWTFSLKRDFEEFRKFSGILFHLLFSLPARRMEEMHAKDQIWDTGEFVTQRLVQNKLLWFSHWGITLILVFMVSLSTHFSSSPVIHSSSPVIHSSSPVIHSSSPVIHSSSPVIHSSSPVIHSSSPVIQCQGWKGSLSNNNGDGYESVT